MKLGLIGAGRIGKLHGEIVTYSIPEAVIKTVADIYADQAKEWADNLQIANAFRSFDTGHIDDMLTKSEAARRLGRDVKAVHGDVHALLNAAKHLGVKSKIIAS